MNESQDTILKNRKYHLNFFLSLHCFLFMLTHNMMISKAYVMLYRNSRYSLKEMEKKHRRWYPTSKLIWEQNKINQNQQRTSYYAINNNDDGSNEKKKKKKKNIGHKSIRESTINETELFYELQRLSAEIRMHDYHYYIPDESSSLDDSPKQAIISDDEYDSLVKREAEICQHYPHILEQLEKSSRLGKKVTRFGGRVGPVLLDHDYISNDTVTLDIDNSLTTEEEEVKLQYLQHLPGSPMMSLDNAVNEDDVNKWFQRIEKRLWDQYQNDSVFIENTVDSKYNSTATKNQTNIHSSYNESNEPLETNIDIVAEPKMDGLSLSLRYKLVESVNKQLKNNFNDMSSFEYKLQWGATRGDGTKGEDVTDAVIDICNASNSSIPRKFTKSLSPSQLPPPSIVEIRGEIILPKSVFQSVLQSNTTLSSNNTNHNETIPSSISFTNARNAASGILRRTKNIENVEFQKLRSSLVFFAYDVTHSDQHLSSVTNSFNIMNETTKDTFFFGDTAQDMRQFLISSGFTVTSPMIDVSIPFCGDVSNNKNETSEINDSETLFIKNNKQIQLLFRYHQELLDSRATLNYEIDGVVYKVSSMKIRAILGNKSRAPKWSIAYKFPSLTGITEIQSIEVQIGRTGALTPVAVLKPVDIGGVTVSRASLHNFQHAQSILYAGDQNDTIESLIDTKKRVKVGEPVLVARAGDVIPQVVRRVYTNTNEDKNQYHHDNHGDKKGLDEESSKNFNEIDNNEWISLEAPTKCPACGSPLVFDTLDNKVRLNTKSRQTNETNSENQTISDDETISTENEGKVLRCSGSLLQCRPQLVGALAHAFSRSALDVSGLSESKISDLVDADILSQPSDLYLIVEEKDIQNQSDVHIQKNRTKSKQMKETISNLPGWGLKSVEKLEDAVKNSLHNGIPLDRFIYSLGIRHVGFHTAKLIATAYMTVFKFMEDIVEASTLENDIDQNCFINLVGDDNHDGVKGIGPKVLSSLILFSKDKKRVKAAQDLMNLLVVHDDSNAVKNDNTIATNEVTETMQLDGKVVVFTGSIPGMTRDEAKNLAKLMGAKSTPSSVSKSTSIVIEGDKGGKKANDAKKLGIDIMSSSEFLNMVKAFNET